jgi:hypothetical protein
MASNTFLVWIIPAMLNDEHLFSDGHHHGNHRGIVDDARHQSNRNAKLQYRPFCNADGTQRIATEELATPMFKIYLF